MFLVKMQTKSVPVTRLMRAPFGGGMEIISRMDELADSLARIPGVEAVALGGSRAAGTAGEDSDWDFGLYYRGALEADDVRALGFDGTVVGPGEWGRIMNGGAWLTIDGQRVDLLYRDLD